MSLCFNLKKASNKPLFLHYRRVHITEETFGNLGGAYQVEEGNGASRDSALDGRKTYLVIDPNTQNSTNAKPKVNFPLAICKVDQKPYVMPEMINFFFPVFLYAIRPTSWDQTVD